MREFLLGDGDIPVSCITLGTDYYGKTVPKERAFELLDVYTGCGGKSIDTAHVYSDYLPGERHSSEKTIGEWLRSRRARQNVVLATKGGFPALDDYSVSRLTPAEIRSDLEESLSCLGVDYVDIYWLHRDDPEKDCGMFVEVLEGFKKEGLIRSYGLSNFTVSRVREADREAVKRGFGPVPAVQIKWGLAKTAPGRVYDRTLAEMDDGYFRFLEKSGKALFAYSSQAKGFFSKLRFDEEGKPFMEPGKCRDRYFCGENIELYKRLSGEARLRGMPVAELAMRKMLEAPFPVTLIVGSRTREQLEASMRAAWDAS
ncbi:MAG: aldo/keto reductase [Clostridia bacterium]|nr:aldo/keto reductase [Clostridia bacterium]